MASGHPADLILLYQVSGTGASFVIGDGKQMRYGGPNGTAKPNQNQFVKRLKVFAFLQDSATGAAATLQFQTSPDNSVWTTVATRTLTVPTTAPFSASLGNGDGTLFKVAPQFFRINVSAFSGGVTPLLNAYCTWGGFGA
jgi:hypothetical protein